MAHDLFRKLILGLMAASVVAVYAATAGSQIG